MRGLGPGLSQWRWVVLGLGLGEQCVCLEGCCTLAGGLQRRAAGLPVKRSGQVLHTAAAGLRSMLQEEGGSAAARPAPCQGQLSIRWHGLQGRPRACR